MSYPSVPDPEDMWEWGGGSYDDREDPRDNDPYWGIDDTRDRDRDNDYEGQQSVGYAAVMMAAYRSAFFAFTPINLRLQKSRDLSWYFA